MAAPSPFDGDRCSAAGDDLARSERSVNSPDTGVVDRDSLTAACVVLGAAVGVFGVAFGVGSVSAGATVTMTCVMSLLVFTGASQFSAVSVIAGGGTVVSALAGASLRRQRRQADDTSSEQMMSPQRGWHLQLLAGAATDAPAVRDSGWSSTTWSAVPRAGRCQRRRPGRMPQDDCKP